MGKEDGYRQYIFLYRLGQTEDTFKITEILLKDKEDLVHKATGWWVRAAG